MLDLDEQPGDPQRQGPRHQQDGDHAEQARHREGDGTPRPGQFFPQEFAEVLADRRRQRELPEHEREAGIAERQDQQPGQHAERRALDRRQSRDQVDAPDRQPTVLEQLQETADGGTAQPEHEPRPGGEDEEREQ